MTVKPYADDASKREQVERMFDNISPRYDLLNRLCSLGIDQGWRRKTMQELAKEPVDQLLDVATGTADLAIMGADLAKHVIGADISQGMLDQGSVKIDKAGMASRIELVQADAAELPFAEATFDAVTVAFGVRNFEVLENGIRGMARVLKPGGRLLVLEFSNPQKAPFKQLFRFYFHHVMPLIGKLVSRDNAAYSYLPESVDAFPQGNAFLAVLKRCGLKEGKARTLTFGVATLYVARK